MSLSQEKIDECKMIFDLYDAKKEGKVSVGILDKILKGLGAYIPSRDFQDYLEELGSDTITYAKFLEFITQILLKKLDKKELLDAFIYLDSAKKNFMPANELKHALLVLGDVLSEEEADELLKPHIKDGNIDYKKLCEEIAKDA